MSHEVLADENRSTSMGHRVLTLMKTDSRLWVLESWRLIQFDYIGFRHKSSKVQSNRKKRSPIATCSPFSTPIPSMRRSGARGAITRPKLAAGIGEQAVGQPATLCQRCQPHRRDGERRSSILGSRQALEKRSSAWSGRP
jgi:hypothetical protein